MKYIIHTWIVVIVTVSSAFSQQSNNNVAAKEPYAERGMVRFGIKAGYTNAKFVGPDVSKLSNGGSASPLNGFHVGITINNKINRHFWLKHDLLFYRQGSMLQLKDTFNAPYKSKFSMSTFTLMPISPCFHFKGFQIFAGPYLSFLSGASIQRKDASGNYYTDKSIFGTAQQLSHYAQKFDFGIVAGLEYEFKMGINIGVRYQRGIVNIFEDAAAIPTANAPIQPQYKIFNQSFSISLGYSFGGHR